MSRLYVYIALLAAILIFSEAIKAQTEATTNTQIITVKILDGRNGKPIAHERILIRTGQFRDALDKFEPIITTDEDGIGLLAVTPTEEKWLRPFVDFHTACYSDIFNVEEIINKGVATPNKCSKKIVREPSPRQFIIFARPATFWERMRW